MTRKCSRRGSSTVRSSKGTDGQTAHVCRVCALRRGSSTYLGIQRTSTGIACVGVQAFACSARIVNNDTCQKPGVCLRNLGDSSDHSSMPSIYLPIWNFCSLYTNFLYVYTLFKFYFHHIHYLVLFPGTLSIQFIAWLIHSKRCVAECKLLNHFQITQYKL